jgi:hypothetical protein
MFLIFKIQPSLFATTYVTIVRFFFIINCQCQNTEKDQTVY